MGKQVLDIEPKNEIYFRGPYSQTVTEYFKITNPTDKRIAFKVKTTAPKRYCVRPSNGVLSPNASESIAVILQPYEGGVRIDKGIHKFMIQSIYAPEGNFNHEDLFKAASPADIMDSKFKCVFDEPIAVPNVVGLPNGENAAAPAPAPEHNRVEPRPHVTIANNISTTNKANILAQGGDDNTLPAYNLASSASSNGSDEFVNDNAAATGVYGEATAKDFSHDEVKRLREQIHRLEEKLKESDQRAHFVPSHFQDSSQFSSQQDSNLYVHLIVVFIAILVGVLVGRLF